MPNCDFNKVAPAYFQNTFWPLKNTSEGLLLTHHCIIFYLPLHKDFSNMVFTLNHKLEGLQQRMNKQFLKMLLCIF